MEQFHERLAKLETLVNTIGEHFAINKHVEDFVEMNVKNTHERIDQVEQLVYDEKEKFRCNDKKPHKCPVCYGSCIVLTEAAKIDFDGMWRAGLDTKKRCDSCEGKGIVWG